MGVVSEARNGTEILWHRLTELLCKGRNLQIQSILQMQQILLKCKENCAMIDHQDGFGKESAW